MLSPNQSRSFVAGITLLAALVILAANEKMISSVGVCVHDRSNNRELPEIFDKSNRREKVISFSLFGNREKYTGGAIANAKLAPTIYPGWKVYYYHRNDVPENTLAQLASMPHVKLFNMSSAPKASNPMTWRFLVALDPEISIYIIRDSDSRLNLRERAAVFEWLEGSDANFHVMHDHPNHCNTPIQGGMWGGRAVLPEILQVVYPSFTTKKGDRFIHWDDTNKLRDIVWPIVQESVFHHDPYCCGKLLNTTTESHPFPTQRASGSGEHVGSVYEPALNGELIERAKNIVLQWDSLGKTNCHL